MQTIECLRGSAKWRNNKQRGTARHRLDSNLTEFVWRLNLGNDTPFDKLLMDLKTYYPPKKKLLTTCFIYYNKYIILFLSVFLMCNQFL